MCDDYFAFHQDSENCFKLFSFFITYRTYKDVGGTYVPPVLVAQATPPPNLVIGAFGNNLGAQKEASKISRHEK